jgi:hypothetical protein
VTKDILTAFLFICRWIVQNYTIQRQIKRNGGSIFQISLDKTVKGGITSNIFPCELGLVYVFPV